MSERAKSALLDQSAQIVLPTIALAEIRFLYAKGRIPVDLTSVLESIHQIGNLIQHGLDESIVKLMPDSLEIHDAIFVATARFYRDSLGHEVRIVTADKDIAQRSDVEVVW